MNIIRTAGMLIYNDKNQILMQNRVSISKRGEERSFFGGHMEEGEDIETALKREIKEELNLEITNYDFFCSITKPDDYRKGFFKETNIFLRKTNMKEEDFTVLEGDYCKFFDIDEIKNLKTFPLTQHLVIFFKNYINNGI